MLPQELKALEITACKIRMDILTATHAAKCGHPGGSLSAADLFTYLYFHELRVDPKNPQDPDRDRFVLSKGHTAPGLYSALAERGFFPVEDLKTLRRIDSYLQGHPNMNHVPRCGYVHRLPGPGHLLPPAAWPRPASTGTRTAGSIPCWATARFRRARSGRP